MIEVKCDVNHTRACANFDVEYAEQGTIRTQLYLILKQPLTDYFNRSSVMLLLTAYVSFLFFWGGGEKGLWFQGNGPQGRRQGSTVDPKFIESAVIL